MKDFTKGGIVEGVKGARMTLPDPEIVSVKEALDKMEDKVVLAAYVAAIALRIAAKGILTPDYQEFLESLKLMIQDRVKQIEKGYEHTN